MTKPSRLLEAALEIQTFCLARQWRFAFIGGIAVQHWGEARLTRDADVELFTGIGEEVNYVDALLNAFESRVDHPRAFAEKHRVPLLRASNRIPLDVSLGALSFEEKAVDEARDAEIARTCASYRRQRSSYSRSSRGACRIGSTSRESSSNPDRASSGRRCEATLATLLELKGDDSSLAKLDAMRSGTSQRRDEHG
ncbi:MAG TPA: hypothetical protein VKV24_07125 [Casimicrobiaceae bacterium]|nr:hypothetical protein [Casimicrobiaceae bacterium]